MRIIYFCFFLSMLICPKLFSQEINPNILYKIVSPSGFVVDNRDVHDNAASLYLSKNEKSSQGQVWKIEKLTNGSYMISNPFIYKSIDNNNTTTGNGNPIIQWDSNKSNINQQWQLNVTGTGAFAIIHKASQMALAFTGEDAIGGQLSQIQKYNKTWCLLPTNIKPPK